MGFYGNLTSANKSNISFDKIYANRTEMEQNASSDDVYVGRYVLIDYDKKGILISAATEIEESYNPDLDLNTFNDLAEGLKAYYDINLLDRLYEKTKVRPAWMIIHTDGSSTFHTGPSYKTPQFLFNMGEEYPYNVEKGDLILLMGKRKCTSAIPSYLKKYPYNAFTRQEEQEIEELQEEHLEGYSLDITRSFKPEIWRCNGGRTLNTYDLNGQPGATYEAAIFVKDDRTYFHQNDNGQYIIDSEDSNSSVIYNFNYVTDTLNFENIGRGWDSTLWQKVKKDSSNGSYFKYIMVAELNSVVPTFDISVDAPTEAPMVPHFGANNSNVYYKIHLQPSWGFRIKGRSSEEYTLDHHVYPSDEYGEFVVDSSLSANGGLIKTARDLHVDDNGNATYTDYTVDLENFKWIIDEEDKSVPLAIYYNKNGFSKYKSFSDPFTDYFDANGYAEGDKETIGVKNPDTNTWSIRDTINVRPSGTTRNLYNVHTNGDEALKANLADTYEMSIMLPSIGTSISQMWDLIFGPNTYHDINGKRLWHKGTGAFTEQQFRKTWVRNLNYEWNTTNGLRAVSLFPWDSKLYVYDEGTYRLYNPETDDANVQKYVRNLKELDNYYPYSGDNIDTERLEFNATSLNTVSGVINSLHDLMGMNIITYSKLSEAYRWDPTKIYFIDGKYYIKYKNYNYIDRNSYKYNTIDAGNMLNLADGNLFRERWGEFPLFEENNIRNLSQSKYIDYIRATSQDDYIDGAVYGTITPSQNIELNVAGYEPNRFFVKSQNSNSSVESYVLDTGDTPTWLSMEVVDDLGNTIEVKNPYYEITATQESGYEFYVPNVYYKRVGGKSPVLCQEANLAAAVGIPNLIDTDDIPETLDITFYRSAPNIQTIAGESQLIVAEWTILTEHLAAPSDPSRFTVETDPNTGKKRLIIKDMSLEDEEIIEQEDSNGNTLLFFNNDGELEEYVANCYQVIGNSEGYASFWEATTNGYTFVLDNDGNKVYKMVPLRWEQSTTITTTDLSNFSKENAIRLKEFMEVDGNNQHIYYFKTTSPSGQVIGYTSETKSELSKLFGRARNTLQDGKIEYFRLEITQLDPYYDLTGNYYYKSLKGDWLRETLPKATEVDVNYYDTPLFTPISNAQRIFVPGKYYEDTALTIPAMTFTPNTTYYERVGDYVSEDIRDNDNNLIWQAGSLWNEKIDINSLPAAYQSKIKRRLESWGYKELKGFAKDINNIHNLINKLNITLSEGDDHTRDGNLVRGAINQINDITLKFGTWTPAEPLMVDTFGRLHSGDWDTNQSGTYENIGTSTSGTIAAADNRWIKMTTESGRGNSQKPHIKLEHQLAYTIAEPTTTTADKNTGNGDGLNALAGDTLDLYTPIVDSQGHIIGKNTETVTLPYGFKTINFTAHNSELINNVVSGTDSIIADTTQDTLTFDSGNKWIHFTPDINNNKITVSHEVNTISQTGGSTTVDLNNESQFSFNIPDWSHDAAGHITNKGDHTYTYTLPNTFETINGITANEAHDSISFNGDNWISITADTENNNLISWEHSNPVETTHVTVNNESPNFGSSFSITDLTFDSKGHKANSGNHTVTIPQGSLTVSEGIDNAKVITNLSFTPSTGALVAKNKNVGELALTGYEEYTETNLTAVADTDSINTAIGKLQAYINNTNDDITVINSNISEINEDITEINNSINVIDQLESELYKTVAEDDLSDETATEITEILQELLDNNHVIRLKPGVYRINEPLIMRNHACAIIGSGSRNTIILQTGIGENGIECLPPKGMTNYVEDVDEQLSGSILIQDIGICTNNSNQGIAINVNGQDTSWDRVTMRTIIENVFIGSYSESMFNAGWKVGIKLTNCNGTKIEGCAICGKAFLNYDNNNNNIFSTHGIHITANAERPDEILRGTEYFITNNKITYFSTGLHCGEGYEGIQVVNNVIIKCLYGCYMGNFLGTHYSFIGNHMNCGTSCIRAEEGTEIVISNNLFYIEAAGNDFNVIHLGTNDINKKCYEVSIIGNQFRQDNKLTYNPEEANSQQYAANGGQFVFVEHGNDIIISSNIVRMNTSNNTYLVFANGEAGYVSNVYMRDNLNISNLATDTNSTTLVTVLS